MPNRKAKSKKKSTKPESRVPELPAEVWLNVFESLNYCQLTTCKMVCKLFKDLTEFSAFDKTLFRNSNNVLPKDATIDVMNLQLNPVFDILLYSCSASINDVCLGYRRGAFDNRRLKDSSAAKEYATDPPVQEIKMQIQSFPIFKTKNKHRVTVLQVMKAVCRFFGKTDYSYIEKQNSITIRHLTYGERMTDRNGWTGWKGWCAWPYCECGVDTDNEGRLFLTANHFDSRSGQPSTGQELYHLIPKRS